MAATSKPKRKKKCESVIQLQPPFANPDHIHLVKPKIEEHLRGKTVTCVEGNIHINLLGQVTTQNHLGVVYVPSNNQEPARTPEERNHQRLEAYKRLVTRTIEKRDQLRQQRRAENAAKKQALRPAPTKPKKPSKKKTTASTIKHPKASCGPSRSKRSTQTKNVVAPQQPKTTVLHRAFKTQVEQEKITEDVHRAFSREQVEQEEDEEDEEEEEEDDEEEDEDEEEEEEDPEAEADHAPEWLVRDEEGDDDDNVEVTTTTTTKRRRLNEEDLEEEEEEEEDDNEIAPSAGEDDEEEEQEENEEEEDDAFGDQEEGVRNDYEDNQDDGFVEEDGADDW